jgi:hypothetical protein
MITAIIFSPSPLRGEPPAAMAVEVFRTMPAGWLPVSFQVSVFQLLPL